MRSNRLPPQGQASRSVIDAAVPLTNSAPAPRRIGAKGSEGGYVDLGRCQPLVVSSPLAPFASRRLPLRITLHRKSQHPQKTPDFPLSLPALLFSTLHPQ